MLAGEGEVEDDTRRKKMREKENTGLKYGREFRRDRVYWRAGHSLQVLVCEREEKRTRRRNRISSPLFRKAQVQWKAVTVSRFEKMKRILLAW